VILPPVVIRPILFPILSVNHRLPSVPAAMPPGELPEVGIGYSAIAPPGVIRPILLPPASVNQTLPSGPRVAPWGVVFAVGMRYWVIR
jgi:hypothetical protein